MAAVHHFRCRSVSSACSQLFVSDFCGRIGSNGRNSLAGSSCKSSSSSENNWTKKNENICGLMTYIRMTDKFFNRKRAVHKQASNGEKEQTRFFERFWIVIGLKLTSAGEVTNMLSATDSHWRLNFAKIKARSETSRQNTKIILTRSFASRVKLRHAQPRLEQ